jgi:hypothetical protein
MVSPIQIPAKFLGILAIQGDPTVSNFDNYIELDFKLKLQPPEDSVVGFYEKYVAAEKIPQTYSEKDVYSENIDRNGTLTSNRIRNYYLSEIFGNQVEIFKQFPFILTK